MSHWRRSQHTSWHASSDSSNSCHINHDGRYNAFQELFAREKGARSEVITLSFTSISLADDAAFRTLELLQGMGAQFTKDQKADKKAQDIAKKPACTVKNTHSVNTSVRRK